MISPSWSLTFELFFYSLIAVLLVFKIKHKQVLFLVYTLLIIFKINLFGYGDSLILDFLFSPLVIEFLAGFFLWHSRAILLKNQMVLGLACLGIVALTFGVHLEAFDGGLRALTFGLFSFCLVVCVMWSEKFWRLSNKSWLVRLGDASYTLYLLHTIVLGWFFSVGLRDWFVVNDLALLGFSALILVTSLFSYLLYRLIEKPLYHWALGITTKK